jgi:DNA-binding transcriptional ArsR family regulator
VIDSLGSFGYFAKSSSLEGQVMQRKHEFRSKIFKALGHPSRILLVDDLLKGERCVCELRDLVEADISTVSKHLSVLKEAGIVGCEKRGANVYYSLRMECVRGFLACVDRFNARRVEAHACVLCGERKAEDRTQNSEVRSQNSEVRSQQSGGRGQSSDGRRRAFG